MNSLILNSKTLADFAVTGVRYAAIGAKVALPHAPVVAQLALAGCTLWMAYQACQSARTIYSNGALKINKFVDGVNDGLVISMEKAMNVAGKCWNFVASLWCCGANNDAELLLVEEEEAFSKPVFKVVTNAPRAPVMEEMVVSAPMGGDRSFDELSPEAQENVANAVNAVVNAVVAPPVVLAQAVAQVGMVAVEAVVAAPVAVAKKIVLAPHVLAASAQKLSNAASQLGKEQFRNEYSQSMSFGYGSDSDSRSGFSDL